MVYLFMMSSLFAPIIFFTLQRKILGTMSLIAIAINVFPIMYSGLKVEMSSPVIAVFLLLSQTLNLVAAFYAVFKLASSIKKEREVEVEKESSVLLKNHNIVEIPVNDSAVRSKEEIEKDEHASKVAALMLGEGSKRA